MRRVKSIVETGPFHPEEWSPGELLLAFDQNLLNRWFPAGSALKRAPVWREICWIIMKMFGCISIFFNECYCNCCMKRCSWLTGSRLSVQCWMSLSHKVGSLNLNTSVCPWGSHSCCFAALEHFGGVIIEVTFRECYAMIESNRLGFTYLFRIACSLYKSWSGCDELVRGCSRMRVGFYLISEIWTDPEKTIQN